MNRLIIFGMVLLFSISSNAQQHIQTVMANGGKISGNGSYSSISVIGEMAVSSFSSSGYSGNIGYLNITDSLGVVSSINYEEDDYLSVYPNPSSGVFYLQSSISLNGVLRMTNVLGEVVNEFKLENVTHSEIDLTHLAAGCYFMISTINGTSTVKHLVLSR